MTDMVEENARKAALIHKVSAGEVIFEEGDAGKEMYVLRSGRVRIYRTTGDNEITLAILGPGESFGEMALLDSSPRSAHAVAVEDTELVVVQESAFEQMLKDRPGIAVRLLKELSSRLKAANRQIHMLTIHGSAARVVEVLRMWTQGAVDEEVHLSGVTPDELWRASGTSREVFGEILHRLGEAGVARFGDSGLHVSWPQGLDEYLEYLDLKRSFDPATQQELAALGRRRSTQADAEEAHSALSPDPTRRATYQRFLDLKQRFEK